MPLDTLFQCNKQWATRPADERFTSLYAMQDHFDMVRANSRAKVVSSRRIEVQPTDQSPNADLRIVGPGGNGYSPTHWAFGQLSNLAGAPAGYLRKLPAPIAADCLNYGLKFSRDIEDVGLLLSRDPATADINIRAATGPKYGRIWNAEILHALTTRFGSGVPGDGGDFTIPGEFGRQVQVTKDNTTLFAGDQDMFVFLADENNRIDVSGRRNGESGSLARGFFVWNSEVGSATFGIATFLFDYVCCNRIVWGATQYKQVTLRHSAGAPDRFIEEVTPALRAMSEGSSAPITKAIADAKAARLEGDEVSSWLATRFGKGLASKLEKVAMDEEGRPIENVWDVTCAVTAYARSIPNQDERVALERKGGALLDMVA